MSHIAPLARVLSGAKVGDGCTIEDHTLIEPAVIIGAGVTIRFGVAIRNGTVIEDGVLIGANVSFSDELGPKSGTTIVKQYATIGAQAVIRSGVTIGERAIVHPGSFVTESVPPLAIVQGNPAHIVGYNGVQPQARRPGVRSAEVVGVAGTTIDGVTLHRLPSAADMRGQLSYAEIGQHVPFEVKRFFLVYGVAGKEVRGEHAHRNLRQFLVCVHGECSVMADDGSRREEFLLDDPTLGLLLPPMVWAVQYKHAADAVLLVLASDRYDSDDYIRDYSEFLHCLARRREP
ncbi:MAG: WxcM domain protein C-terminal domain protein [Bryobacterales bacterium]|nr:WxcM domain protein C-terminal domain protein [Bryobacterales bacterium]